MLTYLARRAALGMLTIWAISLLSFVIIQLPPGDFVTTYIAQLGQTATGSSLEEAQALRRAYGLDRPLLVQYATWISRVARGDLGMSLNWKRPVVDVIGDRIWLTMVVSIAAMVFTWLLALPIGIYSAVRRYTLADHLFTFVGFVGVAVPSFLLALLVMYVGLVIFGADVGGLFSPELAHAPWGWAKFKDLLLHLPLPAAVLALGGTAQLFRIMRANLLDELQKPYVLTARAKGLSEPRLLLKYPVRVALNPFASSIGFLFPQIVSGSVIVSMVLSLPTVGPLLLDALHAQDMFLAGAIVLLLGILTVLGTLISDLVLMWLDPRIRHAGRGSVR
ncbi:MAG TPA: ABC transporter permease [Actinomycetota bacterium]|nr:ABC transporter permease [Actinomycetota bacterium]